MAGRFSGAPGVQSRQHFQRGDVAGVALHVRQAGIVVAHRGFQPVHARPRPGDGEGAILGGLPAIVHNDGFHAHFFCQAAFIL